MPIPDSIYVRITPDTLKDYVGPPIYQKDRVYVSPPPPGVGTDFGYLGNGSGAVMPVEAMVGCLPHNLRASVISLSWVKSHAFELGITSSSGEQFLNDRDIYVHMPEGRIRKEGPSPRLIQILLRFFVSLSTTVFNVALLVMTGEVSLAGQVLPVGGLKVKILAAHCTGIKTIIAPAANRADIGESVLESVKTDIRFVYIEHIIAGGVPRGVNYRMMERYAVAYAFINTHIT
ncbi:peptidase S16 [Infundibulicybe gibba]|nr:peptidase S16 [Infundibulicybe gibba]